ncbi:hypothetical protein [Methylobacterium sp. CM6257]|jgi:hypothetical protein
MGWPRRILIAAGIAAGVTLIVGRFSDAPMPDRSDLLNPDRYPSQTAFAILGRRISRDEVDRLKGTEAGRTELSADPADKLRALVDRDLRAKVVAANEASDTARIARVTGKGHAFWADAGSGIAREDQTALIAYHLSIDRLAEPAATP